MYGLKQYSIIFDECKIFHNRFSSILNQHVLDLSKKLRMIRKIFFLLVISTFIISCGDEENIDIENDLLEVDSSTVKNFVYEEYRIPLPVELFVFLEEKGSFNSEIISDLSVKNDYHTQVESALNLGVYSADLAYCTMLENGQSIVEYSIVAKYFAEKLNIDAAYGEKYIKRLEKNVENPDSLKIIADQAYTKACNYLETLGQYNVLPFVIYGAWVESLYLIIKSESNQITLQEIQSKLLLEYRVIDKIITYLFDVQVETSAYYYYDDLKKIISKLEELQENFDIYISDQSDKNYSKLVQNIEKLKKEI